jgi:hypothetical protein
VAAVDRQGVADVGPRVAVEEAEVDRRRGPREVVEDRALVDAVAAPRPGQAEHRHPPREAAEQARCSAGQAEPRMHRVPPRPLRGRRVRSRNDGVGQASAKTFDQSIMGILEIHPPLVPTYSG